MVMITAKMHVSKRKIGNSELYVKNANPKWK